MVIHKQVIDHLIAAAVLYRGATKAELERELQVVERMAKVVGKGARTEHASIVMLCGFIMGWDRED
jgi:hypothetical protein